MLLWFLQLFIEGVHPSAVITMEIETTNTKINSNSLYITINYSKNTGDYSYVVYIGHESSSYGASHVIALHTTLYILYIDTDRDHLLQVRDASLSHMYIRVSLFHKPRPSHFLILKDKKVYLKNRFKKNI